MARPNFGMVQRSALIGLPFTVLPAAVSHGTLTCSQGEDHHSRFPTTQRTAFLPADNLGDDVHGEFSPLAARVTAFNAFARAFSRFRVQVKGL
jgi:hypothetical protein